MSVFNRFLRQEGFTLIEILIAITLLAFIVIGVVSVTENAADTMDRTTESNKNNLQVETALARFEWDFSQIYSPLYFSTPLNIGAADPYSNNNNDANGDGLDDLTQKPIVQAQLTPELQEYYQRLNQRFERNEHFIAVSKEGIPIPRFYSPETNLFEFFTYSNRRKIENTKQSHFAWVRYTLGNPLPADPDEEINPNLPPSLKTLVRYFAADDPYDDKRIDPEDESKVKVATLLENVESLEFQFWNPQNRKWETSLRSIQSGESLLRGVKMILVFYDSSAHKRIVERIYRNHWPRVVPNDSISPVPGSGTSGGASSGGAPQ